jgi:hypothetical protein
MKKSLAIFCLLAAASGALADPYSMAIQQARRDSAQNDAEQSRLANQESGNASSTPAPGQNAPANNPVLAATLQNISNLQSDLASLIGSDGDHPDPSQKIFLRPWPAIRNCWRKNLFWHAKFTPFSTVPISRPLSNSRFMTMFRKH